MTEKNKLNPFSYSVGFKGSLIKRSSEKLTEEQSTADFYFTCIIPVKALVGG